MKIKLETSNYDFDNEETKKNFVTKVKKNLNIDIHINNITPNAGLRSIAKMCLSSLWGKLGQRTNMTQTKYITEPSKLYEILLDDKLDNVNYQFVNDEMVQMNYNLKDQFVDNSKNTNIFLTCFTTSHARLMLYEKLDKLKDKVIYYDTDSIIYADNGIDSLQTGDLLGDLTDELGSKSITHFVSTGPESYCFKYDKDKEKSAVKGFTLNYKNSSILNHDGLLKIVNEKVNEVTITNEHKIARSNQEIVNKYYEKVFRLGYDKRVIKRVNENHIDTLPYDFI